MKVLSLVLMFLFQGSICLAAIKTEVINYKEGKTELEGHLAYDDSMKGPRPAVVIIHQWKGLSDYEKMRAQQLAEKGYVVLAADIYGKGVRPTANEDARTVSSQYKNDVPKYRLRVKAAIDEIVKNKMVNPKMVVVMGYCFGGTGALEAARMNFQVVGAVSFHGGLTTPSPAMTKTVKPKILVLHGAIDPNVPVKDVEAFMKEMNDAKADYQFIAYSGAVHAFTDKNAGNDPSKGIAYNEAADRRSWRHFMDFLDEVAPVAK